MIAPRKIAEEAVALAEKATRLEWHVGKGGEIVQRGNPYTLPGVICTVSDPEHPSAKADAALIAHAGTHYGTLARAYLELVSDLPVVIEAAERDAQLAEDEAFYERDDPGGDVEESDFLCERAKEVRAAIERLRAGVGEAAEAARGRGAVGA